MIHHVSFVKLRQITIAAYVIEATGLKSAVRLDLQGCYGAIVEAVLASEAAVLVVYAGL